MSYLRVPMLNRSALVVKPKQPFIDWANSLDGMVAQPSHDASCERTIYLVEEVSDDFHAQAILVRHFARIFDHELWAWRVDQEYWPPKRDLATFRAWFEVELHSVVLDLSDVSLEVEDVGA